jgi:glycosyltransferase involved in cell wall biosynthesis
MPHGADSLVILLPVFDDWPAVTRLIPQIVSALSGTHAPIGILVVDDGSSLAPAKEISVSGLAWLRVLRLRRNLGHQRAIAVGLSYIDEHIPCDTVIVMDADGEDRPEDLPRLLERYRNEGRIPMVFAERVRRVESLGFRLFYAVYRLQHRVLTGRGVKFGNFSVIPRERLASLVVVSELWIHYAAAAVRSRQPICTVPTARGSRLDGRSQMSFVSLVVHGLSAIAVYSDVVFTRLVVAMACLIALSIAGMAVVAGIRLFSTMAIPGWSTYAFGMLLLVLVQAATFIVSLIFIVLGSRQQSHIIPRRDYSHYVAGVREIANGGLAR